MVRPVVGMPPIRRQLSHGQQHEGPFVQAGMGENDAAAADRVAVGQDIEIEDARLVGFPPGAPEIGLDSPQRRHQQGGGQCRIGAGDAIDVPGLGGQGHRGRAVPARSPGNADSRPGHGAESRLAGLPRFSMSGTGQVGADADQDQNRNLPRSPLPRTGWEPTY